jgi:nitroimidazol reductase NimA-like FMN-containing flavoprotein (pyridoxamine 5'-phosphate oxidase superfamily)
MPAGYGISRGAKGRLPWRWAEERLAASRNYWIVTADLTGRPHAMPVWGVWLDGAVWFSSDQASRKARNIEARPEIVVHLESGDEVVILEGRAEIVTDRPALERFADVYEEKYGFRMDLQQPIGLVYRLPPRAALGWTESALPRTATGWEFP